MKDNDIKSLAREIAQELASKMVNEILDKLNKTKYLMTKPEVAVALGYDRYSSAVEKIIADPTFPPPLEISEGGRRRWRTKDIESWIDSKKKEKERLIMSLPVLR